MTDHRMEGAPSYRYSESLHQVNLSSLHRTRAGVNNAPSSSAPLDAPKTATALTSKTIPYREPSSVSERSSSSSPVKSNAPGPRDSVTQFCLCQPDPKIPRPRNAFILYRQHYQAAVVAQNPGLANPEISKIIGEQWRKLPQATKDEWKSLAEEEKARHQQQYPEYRYQPRRYGRDGTSRSLSSGISHNPPGSTICTRCGGRIMNPPASPDNVFASSDSVSSARPSQSDAVPARRCSTDRGPGIMKLGSHAELRQSRQRQWDENGSQSPDSKRRRTNPHLPFRTDHPRDRSPPDTPYPIPLYASRTDSVSARGISQITQAQRGLRPVKDQPQLDPSLKLPPLQTTTPVSGSVTPATPFPQSETSVEATIKNIPFLNRIKVLAKISPPLPYSFREGDPRRRGPVIAVDGQDATLVKAVTEYLSRVLKKEGKFHTRIFEGPESQPRRESSAESEEMNDGTIEYMKLISSWHHISDEIKSFVKFEAPRPSAEPGSGNDEEGSPGISPRTIIPKAAEMHISSPPASSENGSETASSPPETAGTGPLPVALIPQYQLTTADAYACLVPLGDSFGPLDHWQWMASLWRASVGPDITVYVRECEAPEMKQVGGNPVEIRLHDARTVVIRRPANSPKELEDKVLRRVGFEIEDYLTQ
ncbi:putative HMG box transcriptional regulator [Aspergillus lucknowensis]|uniref:HMG box domain-containing protein n=1 Tax=Aspergillus lucknowensis TaxID=176173 RepID=A0ABR4LE93_9EURO